MEIFEILKSIFSSSELSNNQAVKELRNKLEIHPIRRHQVNEIEEILSSFISYRFSSKKNVGLSINAVEGAGKTHFIIEFLSDYFKLTGITKGNKIYKLNSRQLVMMKPYFEKKLIIEKNKNSYLKLQNILNNLELGSIVILDDFYSKEPVLPYLFETIESILNNKRYNQTCFILSGGYQKMKFIRKDYQIEYLFPLKFELQFTAPTLNQLVELFIDYMRVREIKFENNVIPTLKYYFKKKQELSKMSRNLIYNGKLDKKEKITFAYARELEDFLNSIILTKGNTNILIQVSDVRNSPLFLKNERKYNDLKRKYS